MAYENILFEVRENGVAVLTINRPKVLNALNQATLDELNQALDEVAANDAIKVLVVTGAGDKSFVAGADINEFELFQNAYQAEEMAQKGQRLTQKIEALPKPVIMAINGYALGGGCELAMAGDIRIASRNARFGQPEVNLGIIPGYGGTQRLPRLVGKGMAKYLCMTGDHITADEAWRIGLVEKVVEPEALMDEALQLAEKLASKPPIALHLIKKAIQEGPEMDLDNALKMEAAYFGLAMNTEDRVEGTRAFLEKRPARFTGK
ncbi:MAG: enoyl-CoA hydratase [Bacillaceae bacterium G1]|nr:enoyl-CoA hydratase [Bacillota bacterium]OJF16758.1 MAG: enoyl-CoA hydratase [Bacillaceae bacterium G1]